MNKGHTGFRIMARDWHTSRVWNAGTFTNRPDADRHIKVDLEPLTGAWIIYRTEAF